MVVEELSTQNCPLTSSMYTHTNDTNLFVVNLGSLVPESTPSPVVALKLSCSVGTHDGPGENANFWVV